MEETTERQGRRGSLGRAFLRLRNAIKRRSRRNGVEPTTQPNSLVEEAIDEPATHGDVTAEPLKSTDITSEVSPMNTASVDIPVAVPLLLDSGEMLEMDDTDEPLLPMLSTRTRLSNGRAQKLFAKYGIKYEPSNIPAESRSSDDVRRIEKPIRIRIHWTCHECKTSFAVSRTCTNCGHRRCRDCPRSPAKRVREVMETAQQQKEQDKQPPTEPKKQRQTMTVPPAASCESTSSPPVLQTAESLESEHEDTRTSEDAEAIDNQYLIQHTPRSEMQLILRPMAQIVQRTCHECQTHFKSALETECRKCGHTKCNLCPRDPPNRERWTQGTPDERPPPIAGTNMIGTVQRVYRKPRQRVRWTCDQCQSIFVERERCRECGHERCGTCTRNPYVISNMNKRNVIPDNV